ncbi:hypothetical protein Acr_21g0008180 [Actinidia rufa]|uniref:Uncharacterized protein n=1 Tax=Actinidia rufa TaxID=165716 RepID=A0A7J0GHD2_9ERIC|nr:hypothetical protein Acr_21g0008180 [Actinidia rufa]
MGVNRVNTGALGERIRERYSFEAIEPNGSDQSPLTRRLGGGKRKERDCWRRQSCRGVLISMWFWVVRELSSRVWRSKRVDLEIGVWELELAREWWVSISETIRSMASSMVGVGQFGGRCLPATLSLSEIYGFFHGAVGLVGLVSHNP